MFIILQIFFATRAVLKSREYLGFRVTGNYSVRIFFADFTKGFDIIDHSVLLDELKSFDIDQTLFLGTLLSD